MGSGVALSLFFKESIYMVYVKIMPISDTN